MRITKTIALLFAALLGGMGIGSCAALEALGEGDVVGAAVEAGKSITAGVQALGDLKMADKYEPSEEYYIGRGVSAVIVGRYEPVEAADEVSTKQILYMNEMAGFVDNAAQGVTRSAMKLGGHVDRGYDAQQRVNNLVLHKGLQVGLLKTDEVTAFATPGGFIWISRGAIAMCDNEDEVAAIVCHELAHILLNHGMDSYRDKNKGEITKGALNDVVFTGQGLGSNFGHMVTGIADDIFDQYDPEQELEADAWGTLALQEVGYDPKAMERMLLKVESYEKAHSGGEGDYLKAHPPIEERIKLVRELIKEENLQPSNPKALTPEALTARQQRFVDTFKK